MLTLCKPHPHATSRKPPSKPFIAHQAVHAVWVVLVWHSLCGFGLWACGVKVQGVHQLVANKLGCTPCLQAAFVHFFSLLQGMVPVGVC